MAWSSLASNQFVSRSDLQDAVTTGVFTLKSGQTIPGTESNRWVTRSEVETWINATVSNGTSNQYPQKSWIVASGTPFRTYAAYIGPYQVSGFCDSQNFPHTIYTADVNPPTTVYSDSGLTTQIVGLVYINNPSEANYMPFWSKSSSGSTGSWVNFYRKNSQTFPNTTCTANVGSNTYTKAIGESMYRRQGNPINSLTVTINSSSNVPAGGRWRVTLNSGGVNSISGPTIYASAWTNISNGSNISATNINVTCDVCYFAVELESATVVDGTSITVSGSWVIP